MLLKNTMSNSRLRAMEFSEKSLPNSITKIRRVKLKNEESIYPKSKPREKEIRSTLLPLYKNSQINYRFESEMKATTSMVIKVMKSSTGLKMLYFSITVLYNCIGTLNPPIGKLLLNKSILRFTPQKGQR